MEKLLDRLSPIRFSSANQTAKIATLGGRFSIFRQILPERRGLEDDNSRVTHPHEPTRGAVRGDSFTLDTTQRAARHSRTRHLSRAAHRHDERPQVPFHSGALLAYLCVDQLPAPNLPQISFWYYRAGVLLICRARLTPLQSGNPFAGTMYLELALGLGFGLRGSPLLLTSATPTGKTHIILRI